MSKVFCPLSKWQNNENSSAVINTNIGPTRMANQVLLINTRTQHPIEIRLSERGGLAAAPENWNLFPQSANSLSELALDTNSMDTIRPNTSPRHIYQTKSSGKKIMKLFLKRSSANLRDCYIFSRVRFSKSRGSLWVVVSSKVQAEDKVVNPGEKNICHKELYSNAVIRGEMLKRNRYI